MIKRFTALKGPSKSYLKVKERRWLLGDVGCRASIRQFCQRQCEMGCKFNVTQHMHRVRLFYYLGKHSCLDPWLSRYTQEMSTVCIRVLYLKVNSIFAAAKRYNNQCCHLPTDMGISLFTKPWTTRQILKRSHAFCVKGRRFDLYRAGSFQERNQLPGKLRVWQVVGWLGPEVLALKHESRILGQCPTL